MLGKINLRTTRLTVIILIWDRNVNTLHGLYGIPYKKHFPNLDQNFKFHVLKLYLIAFIGILELYIYILLLLFLFFTARPVGAVRLGPLSLIAGVMGLVIGSYFFYSFCHMFLSQFVLLFWKKIKTICLCQNLFIIDFVSISIIFIHPTIYSFTKHLRIHPYIHLIIL